MIIKFKKFINEGIRDMMTPKSEEEVNNHIPIQMKDLYNRIPYEKEYHFSSIINQKLKIFVKFKHALISIMWDYDNEVYSIIIFGIFGDKMYSMGESTTKNIDDVLYKIEINAKK